MSTSDSQIADRETTAILDALQSCLILDGDVVEFGCYKGDTSVKLAELMRNQPEKWLWLYDSFAGLPEKGSEDMTASGHSFQKGALLASADVVRQKFRKHRLPDPVIKQAWFKDLQSSDLPDQICFALLDGDFYDSILTSLDLAAPRLVKNGLIMVHDYRNPALPGSKKAVHAFLNRLSKTSAPSDLSLNSQNFRFSVREGMAVLQRL